MERTVVMNIQQIKSQCLNAEFLSEEVLKWIGEKNYWNLWVPRQLGGLELSLGEGLKVLRDLAKIDGSLGWTVTLCSGANYFTSNLRPQIAQNLVEDSSIIFGGSGGAWGTAVKTDGCYHLNGTWKYATGAPYLTHFTLNAKVVNGTEKEEILSFLIPAEDVEIINDWNSMGLKATATNSFRVKNKIVSEEFAFVYNRFYQSQPVFKIPFSLFADLTLLVNYLGMAENYLNEAGQITEKTRLNSLENIVGQLNDFITKSAQEIENKLEEEEELTESFEEQIHQKSTKLLALLTNGIIEVYPFLGMRAARRGEVVNQIFRDYFTATQHHNFVNR